MEHQKRIVDAILGEHIRHRNEYLYYCPICHHHKQKLSVNYEKNTFKCWVCEYVGLSIFNLVKRFGNYEQIREFRSLTASSNPLLSSVVFSDEARPRQEVKRITSLPLEYTFLAKAKNARAIDFLREREVDVDDIFAWKIGFCESGKYWDRIIVPSFNSNGICNFFSARSINKSHEISYLIPSDVSKNDIVFNELNVDWNEDVYLTEGVFDAIKIGKRNVIPLMGKTLSAQGELMRKLCIYNPTVYVCLDTDRIKKGYVNRSIKLAEQLMSFGIDNIFIIDPFPYKDFGEIPKNKIENFLKQNRKISGEFDLLSKELEQLENLFK